MRKMMVMVVGMIFLVGCATSGDFKTLNKQVRKIALGVEECQQFIQVDFDQALKEQNERIDALEWRFAERTEVTEPVARAEVVKPAAKAPTKKVLKHIKVAKVRLKPPAQPLLPVKPTKAETMESQLAKLTERVNDHDKRLSGHDRKFSDLLRRIAETEDETKPLYLWTKEFTTGSSKLTGKNEKKLDGLALELLKGTLKVERDVEGYADPRGKQKDNEELSKERAQSCIDYLLTKLGADNNVTWEPGTTWKKYFTALAGGPTKRYGNFKYNRRVRFQKKK